ncbi:MAG: hypothetical protein ABIG84_07660 [archaeon]
MPITTDFEMIISFFLISILIFSAINIIYLTRISSSLKQQKQDTKEDHTTNRDILAEKIETNHNILSELNMKIEKINNKK